MKIDMNQEEGRGYICTIRDVYWRGRGCSGRQPWYTPPWGRRTRGCGTRARRGPGLRSVPRSSPGTSGTVGWTPAHPSRSACWRTPLPTSSVLERSNNRNWDIYTSFIHFNNRYLHVMEYCNESIDDRREARIFLNRVIWDDIGAFWWVLTPSFEEARSSPKKSRLARRYIWRYHFQVMVWDCQIINQALESQLFTSSWGRYHQWLSSDIELVQISAFSASYSWISPCFTARKRIGVWNFSHNLQTW